MKKLIILSICCLYCLNGWGQDSLFDRYDKDGNGHLGMDEFTAMLTDKEMYYNWDQNENGLISFREWSDGLAFYYPGHPANMYEQYLNWDMNGDHFVEDIEFTVGHFTFWDRDLNQNIDPEEWAVYGQWEELEAKEVISSTTGF